MRKGLLTLLSLVMCVLFAGAKDVVYDVKTVYQGKQVTYPLTWEQAPFETSLTIQKYNETKPVTATTTLALNAQSTIVVESVYPMSQIKFTGTYTNSGLTADCGTKEAYVWTAPEGGVKKVTFTASKTIAFGSATITYEPKETYQPAEWVRFDGSDRGNCMTTDYIPTTPTKIGIGFTVEGGDDAWRAIFCARNVGAGTGISLYKNGNQSNLGFFTGGTTGAGDGFAPLTCGQRYDVEADVTKLRWSTDGENWEEKETGNSVTNETSRCLSIFANPEWDQALKGTIYYLTIFEGETQLCNYTPAVRTSDGRIGYIDAVNGKFLTSLKGNQGYTCGLPAGAFMLKGMTESLVVPEMTTKALQIETEGTADEIIFKSSNPAIATVDAEGNVTGTGIGTCTIYCIATKGDLRWTKTAEVEVTGVVKNSYSKVDFIYFDGKNENYTYYYETGYLPKYNTVIDLKCKAYEKSKGSWRAVFSGRDNTSNGMSLYMNGSGDDWGYFVSGNNEDWAGKFHVNTDYTVNFTKDALTVNGEVTKTKSGITADNFKSGSHTISIFSGVNDWPFYGQISYFTISEDNGEAGMQVVHNYEPVMRHDGKAFLHDTVTGEYIAPKNADGFFCGVEDNTSARIITLAPSQTIFKGFSGSVVPEFINLDKSRYTMTCTSQNGLVTIQNDGTFSADQLGQDIITVKLADSEAGDVWELTQTINIESAVIAADKFEQWDGQNDAILGSIRIGGDQYKAAYTVTFDSGRGFSGDQNANNPDFNKVWGVPAEDEAGNAWYAANYEMTNTESAVWSYNSTTLPNGWPGNMGEVYVRRYFKAEGELPAQLYMPAPHDDAPCEYYINGTLVWARTGFEPGVNGWYEDEIVKLNDAQRGLIKTDGSMNVFAYHVHQNWGGRYADGGIYGNSMADNSPSKRFESNENVKRLASAVAQAEGIEGFPADVLDYCQKASVCLQDVEPALYQIRWELRKALSPRHNYTMASAAPEDKMEVWLYNVGTGQFLCGSNDWGTHASVDYNISAWPMILHTNTSGANRYTIQTNLPNGRRGENDWLGHNGYVDCGGPNFGSVDWAWEFKAVGNGNYLIINSQNGGSGIYLGVTLDDRYQIDTNRSGPESPYNQWKLITRDMFEQLAANATAEQPADVSYYIHQNNFSQNDFDGANKDAANNQLNDSPWQRNAGSIWNWKGNDADGDYVYEMWNCADMNKVVLKQTIEGLPAGKYIVECTGFYRDGNYDSAIGGADRKLAFLYAGTEQNKTFLPSILDGAGQGAGYGRVNNIMIPDGCKDAPKFFRLGAYTTQTAAVNVGFDGKLEIGIVRDGEDAIAQDWIVVDNFRLYRIGKVDAEVTVGEALYATYTAPVDVDFTGAEVQAYAAQTKEGYIHLEPVTTVPAGTAVVVKANAAGTYQLSYAAGAVLGQANDLVASKSDVTADGTQYILGKADGEVGFYKANADTQIAAGKGFIVIAAETKAFLPFGDDNATAIDEITAQGTQLDAPIFNLAGQRVKKTQKGVFIQDGKKVAIK